MDIKTDDYFVMQGNCLERLKELDDNSIDSVVTDPPYELGFMGKKWDNSGIAFNVDVWLECLRVLKPGGHLLAFGGTRTWHRLCVAIEDAGFEVRDSIAWLYGSGFPKSMNIALQMDKQAGVQGARGSAINVGGKGDRNDIETSVSAANGKLQPSYSDYKTDDAKKWAGWGTALKPAFEPIVVARKPVVGTVAKNTIKYGTGGLNIDATRIEASDQAELEKNWDRVQSMSAQEGGNTMSGGLMAIDLSDRKPAGGRWPANILLDEFTAGLVDEQSDSASRFFYVSKANKKDRNEGLGELPEVQTGTFDGNIDTKNARKIDADPAKPNQPQQNFHPTVKPTDLMRYLIKLVTPPNGTVLDPFTGSGSTGKAALLEGHKFVGVELTEEYFPIIKARLDHSLDI